MTNEQNFPVVPENAALLQTVVTKQGMFSPSAGGDTSGFGGLVERFELSPAAVRPFGGWFDEVADAIIAAAAASNIPAESVFERVSVDRGEITFFVAPAHLRVVMQALRDEPALKFEMCMGVNGVHYPFESGRELHAVYPLQSITHNRRIRVEVAVSDENPHIPSVVDIYPGNNWHERETWDFFGIVFDGHPGLTRIEMPDDWPGHPQRKDYPLGGIDIEYKGATVPAPDKRRSYS